MAIKRGKRLASGDIINGPSIMSLMISHYDGKRVNFTLEIGKEQIPFNGYIEWSKTMTPERISWKIGGVIFCEILFKSTIDKVLFYSDRSFFFSASYNINTRKGKIVLNERS